MAWFASTTMPGCFGFSHKGGGAFAPVGATPPGEIRPSAGQGPRADVCCGCRLRQSASGESGSEDEESAWVREAAVTVSAFFGMFVGTATSLGAATAACKKGLAKARPVQKATRSPAQTSLSSACLCRVICFVLIRSGSDTASRRSTLHNQGFFLKCSDSRTESENSLKRNPMAAPPSDPPKLLAVSLKLRLI